MRRSLRPRREKRMSSAIEIDEYDWFETLFGFSEIDYNETKNKFSVVYKPDKSGFSEGLLSSSDKPGTHWSIGKFYYPTLGELREMTRIYLEDTDESTNFNNSKNLSFCAVADDIQHIHGQQNNKYATIQVASQFNCLEFVEPGVKPEHGVTRYCSDKTQGPACCLCTGPAVVYRNYLHHYEDEIVVKTPNTNHKNATSKRSISNISNQGGQTAHRQADMLSDFSREIGNRPAKAKAVGSNIFWDMKGGYMMSSTDRLQKIPWNKFHNSDSDDGVNRYEKLIETIRIGIHEDIQVTHCGGFGLEAMQETDMRVTHCLSSAVPINYNTRRTRTKDWEILARIILKASYECVFRAAILNMIRHNGEGGSRKVFLTSVGGGVFGNRGGWINDAIIHCCTKFKKMHLEVYLVCYGKVDVQARRMEAGLKNFLAQ